MFILFFIFTFIFTFTLISISISTSFAISSPTIKHNNPIPSVYVSSISEF